MSRGYARPSQPTYQRPKEDERSSPKCDQQPSAPISLSWNDQESPKCDEKPSPKCDQNSDHKGGMISIRLSSKAKSRLKRRKHQQEAFKAMLKTSDLVFTKVELEGRDYSKKLNVDLSAEEYQRIKDAAERYVVGFYVIASAIIMQGSK